MASFINQFYHGKRWQKTRDAYKHTVGGLCERCARNGLITPGTQVHHKIRLTPDNVNDASISLNFDNLQLLCDECHQAEHHNIRWRVDEAGHVIV